MRVYIYAYEDEFHGLHGMYEACIEDVKTWNEIDDFGSEMAESVLSSYSCFNYDEEEWDSEEDFYDWLEESKTWTVYKIKDEVTLSIEKLNEELSRLGAESFEEEYCDKVFDVYDAMKGIK